MKNLKSPEIIFAIFALLFGTIIMFITPQFQVADEPAHFERAIEVSNGTLYNKLPEKRQDAYKFHGASGYSPVMYMSSALGYKIGNLSNNDQISFYCGRFFNLAVWILLIFTAIKITPVFKWQFLFVALFPMSVQQGMSYSADSFNNAFAFLFFAYIFKLIYEYKDISIKKDYPLICTSSIIGAMCKGIIYPACFIITKNINRTKKILILLTILLCLIIGICWSVNNYSAQYPGVIASDNTQILLKQPLLFVKHVSRTCMHYFPNWAGQLVGKLGVSDIKLNNIIYILTALFFAMSFIFIPEKYKIKMSQKILGLLLFIFYATSTFVLMFINWTPLDSAYIQGIQGRYFLPVMPLLFLVLAFNLDYIKPKFSNIFIRLLICYIFIMYCYTVILLTNVYSYLK